MAREYRARVVDHYPPARPGVRRVIIEVEGDVPALGAEITIRRYFSDEEIGRRLREATTSTSAPRLDELINEIESFGATGLVRLLEDIR